MTGRQRTARALQAVLRQRLLGLLRFLTGVRASLQPPDQRYVDLALEEMFTRPFSTVAVRDYMLKALARALAGDQAAKQGYFILGEFNTGKGMQTRFLELTFPGVVAQFNASHLCAESSNDPAKDYQWVVPIFHSRIVVSNEFNLRAAGGRTERARINSNIWKSVVSGGTDRVECRLLHRNAIKVIPRFTPFILANDMPEFDNPSDSGTQTRTVAMRMDRHAVDREPAGPHEFRADKTLEGRIAQREYQNGLIWLLFDYFARFLREGHDKPDAVRAETGERLPQDGPWVAITDAFEPWPAETQAGYGGNLVRAVRDGWSVRTSAVRDTAAQAWR